MSTHPYRTGPKTAQDLTWVHVTPTYQVSARYIKSVMAGKIVLTDGTEFAVSDAVGHAAQTAIKAWRRS